MPIATVLFILLAGKPDVLTDDPAAPTGNEAVDACRSQLREETTPNGSAREAAGRCAVAFKQPACADAIRESVKKGGNHWPSEARRACCAAYASPFAAAHFLDVTELCNDDQPLTDRRAAVHAWFDFAQGAFTVDWKMSPSAAIQFAQGFSRRFVPDPVELPEDVKKPVVQMNVALVRIPTGGPLTVMLQDPRAPVPRKIELNQANATRWEPLVEQLKAAAPKVGVVLLLSQGATTADLEEIRAAMRRAGISMTVDEPGDIGAASRPR